MFSLDVVAISSGASTKRPTRTTGGGISRAIRAAAPGHVKLIYFNDPVLIEQGLVRPYAGHDDHLHIRYCVTGFADPNYRC